MQKEDRKYVESERKRGRVCVGGRERECVGERDRKSELVSAGKKIAGRQQIKQAAVTNQLAHR